MAREELHVLGAQGLRADGLGLRSEGLAGDSPKGGVLPAGHVGPEVVQGRGGVPVAYL